MIQGLSLFFPRKKWLQIFSARVNFCDFSSEKPASRRFIHQLEKKQCSEWRSENSHHVDACTSLTVPLNVMGAFENLSSVVLGSLFRIKSTPFQMIAQNVGFEKASLIIVMELLVLLYQHQRVTWFCNMNDWLPTWCWMMAGSESHQLYSKAPRTPLNVSEVIWVYREWWTGAVVTFLLNCFLPEIFPWKH